MLLRKTEQANGCLEFIIPSVSPLDCWDKYLGGLHQPRHPEMTQSLAPEPPDLGHCVQHPQVSRGLFHAAATEECKCAGNGECLPRTVLRVTLASWARDAHVPHRATFSLSDPCQAACRAERVTAGHLALLSFPWAALATSPAHHTLKLLSHVILLGLSLSLCDS